jgi:DNA repair exonuclease SbcCD ATPase subunit
MTIERVQVDGGFLDRLDLRFAAGFNVLIGARGTGKTSIIELIRFALDLPFLSEKVRSETRDHARAVLVDGSVTVTYREAGHVYRVSRNTDDREPNVSIAGADTLVLAQNEIEGIGVNPVSRLRLVDRFLPSNGVANESTDSLQSVEAEASGLRRELAALDEQLANYADVAAQLVALRAERRKLALQRKESTAGEKALDELNESAQRYARALEHVRHVDDEVNDWIELIRGAADGTPTLKAVSDATLYPSLATRTVDIKKIRDMLEAARMSAILILGAAKQDRTFLLTAASNIDAQARPIRASLEEFQKGAGDLARRISALEKKVAQGEALAEYRGQKAERLEELRQKRTVILDAIDTEASTRSIARERVAKRLSQHLRPSVKIEIAQRANLSAYISAIGRALRGTGIHATSLAEQLAKRISPRQLVELVETGDRTSLAKYAQISVDRSQRLISALNAGGTSELIGASVEDDVRISLLVGPDYRDIEHLSTGQRCTAVLPILLSQESGCLIIDQPEDHLDNAYVVDTLVSAIRSRSPELQVIFSTHNPNVAVLGEAQLVVDMVSDGVSGYCESCDMLDAPASVNAITSVMEGGRAAFAQRAKFYAEHASPES